MKILMISRFFNHIWFTDKEHLFHSYFEKKYDKVLTFNIVHFLNFEISASLLLLPPCNERRIEQFQNLTSAGGVY